MTELYKIPWDQRQFHDFYDDVIKWRDFPRYWPFLRGITGRQRPVTRSFDVFFDLRQNKRLSKQSWRRWFETPPRSLWRQRRVYSCIIFRCCWKGLNISICNSYATGDISGCLLKSKVRDSRKSQHKANLIVLLGEYSRVHIKTHTNKITRVCVRALSQLLD